MGVMFLQGLVSTSSFKASESKAEPVASKVLCRSLVICSLPADGQMVGSVSGTNRLKSKHNADYL